MRAAVALMLSSSLLTGACFPENARHRTYAKIVEGGVALGGIGLLFTVNSGADCMASVSGLPNTSCEDRASLLGNVGLGLVLAGLIGFIVTVSTSPDDKVAAPPTAAPPVAPTANTPPPAPPEPTPPPVDPAPPTPPTDPTPPTTPPAP